MRPRYHAPQAATRPATRPRATVAHAWTLFERPTWLPHTTTRAAKATTGTVTDHRSSTVSDTHMEPPMMKSRSVTVLATAPDADSDQSPGDTDRSLGAGAVSTVAATATASAIPIRATAISRFCQYATAEGIVDPATATMICTTGDVSTRESLGQPATRRTQAAAVTGPMVHRDIGRVHTTSAARARPLTT